MFFVLKPFLRIIGNIYHNKEVFNKTIVAFMLFILIVSAYTTEALGIHALFGAFMAGVIMPSNTQFRKIMTEKVEDVALAIFLPLFFVSTGLKTQLGLINTPDEWIICGMFIGVAIFGKIAGTTLPARFVGETWKDSWLMGTLMNTRGLMELIVLTIGYEMNILPPSIFAMLVLMTLVTTLMTGPLLSLIHVLYRRKEKIPETITSGKLRVLLSFGRALSGSILLNVAQQIFSGRKQGWEVTALHLTVGTEVNPMHTENFETSSFAPILQEAKRLNIPIQTRYEVTNDAGHEIVNMVNQDRFDFLLVGAGISMSDLPSDIEAAKQKDIFYQRYFSKLGAPQSWFYPGDLLKDKTHMFIKQTRATVGIFVNRDFKNTNRVIVVLKNQQDYFLLEYAANMIQSNNSLISLLEIEKDRYKNMAYEAAVREFLTSFPQTQVINSNVIPEELLITHDFMLVGYDTWNIISETEKIALQSMPSTLIVNKGKQLSNTAIAG